MNNRILFFLVSLVLALSALCSAPAFAQQFPAVLPGPGWQVIRAEWGAGERHMDVTNQVRALLSGEGMIRVNNQNMGGDPAVGADKVLRIKTRNFEGQVREFTFREGGTIDASQFYNYAGGMEENDRPGWRVMWADYGAGPNRVNVTDRVRALLSGSRIVRVDNQNMGGDPAVGADKVLRIAARGTAGQVRDFAFREGSTINASEFYNYEGYRHRGDRDAQGDRDDRPGRGEESRMEGPGLRIVKAFYGVNDRTNDVTRMLREMVRENSLFLQVNNRNLGGDPAVGADKVLTVIYRYNGREETVMVKEGRELRIP
jgi:hypothetical protein